MKLPTYTVLRGKELEDFLKAGIEIKKDEVISHLTEYDGHDLFPKWLMFIRCIEEFINIRYVISADEWMAFEKCSIDIRENKRDLMGILKIVQCRFGNDVLERIKSIIIMLLGLRLTYQKMRLPGMECKTIADAVNFIQSRRLYYVAYLTLIRLYAKGSKKAQFIELLCHFQSQVDFNIMPITTAFHSIIGNRCIDGYEARANNFGVEFSMHYNQLENFFLEPLTMSEIDIIEYEHKNISTINIPKNLYSYAELLYTVKQAETLFKGYGIDESLVLQEIRQMVLDLDGQFIDEYSICMTEDIFKDFCMKYPHLRLFSEAQDYYEAINERPAFFQNESNYYSTVLLIIRYVENTIYGLLRKNRRYRIKAGFLFEKRVKALLEKYGYECTNVKRIHKQEFDVLCRQGDCIYNFQCKNNYLDINNLTIANIDKVCGQNKRLVKYYQNALDKENFRTKWVIEKFGVEKVENYVVARFPIVMNHKRLIAFNKLEEWLKGEKKE